MLPWYNGNKKGDSFSGIRNKKTKQKAIKLLSLKNFHGIIKLYFERRSRSDCIHEQIAKQIAKVRFI